jgi:hypothetical protein
MVRRDPGEEVPHSIAPFSSAAKRPFVFQSDMLRDVSMAEVHEEITDHLEVRANYNMVVGRMLCDESA